MDTQKEIGKVKGRLAEHDGEIAALKVRIESLEAQFGKAAQTAATPGASFEVTHACGDKVTHTGMPGVACNVLEAAKERLAERPCPDCETKKEQEERKAEGKRIFEGREVDEKAMVTRRG